MDSKKRRLRIEDILKSTNTPHKGHSLAEELGVTRQVIVKDVALLRAEGKEIIATPEGYIMPKHQKNMIKRVVAFSHKTEEIEDELKTIVKFGGIIEDVIIEHTLYGEIKGMLMIKTLYDIENFIKKLNAYKAEPLLTLTSGIHLHTILAESNESMEIIIEKLNRKKYLASD